MGASPDPLSVFAPDLFRGRTALVTGGGRGIGKRIALAFAGLGANVVIASRKPENLDPTAGEISARGGRCLAVPTNIRDTDQVEALVERSLAEFGAIDFLVNNAGGQFPARPSQISDRGWRSVVDLNLNGTWNMCSRVAPHMIARGTGAIVNVVHVYAFDRGAPAFAHSGAARAGVVNLTRTLAFYLARKGVTVNALAPGTVATRGVREEEFSAADRDDYEVRHAREIPARRLADADEIAAVVLFLCSPAARYINGAALVADGGHYLDNWIPLWETDEY
jgi:NAD(P)-dependent dehydrogenase (short-subunit alcohol dehydrogenase family)